MKTLTGQKLVETLRKSCDNVTKRLWIASPFIGHWSTVRRILGRRWIDDGRVDVRLITDFSNNSVFNYETIKRFYDRGKIKSIMGLHAKIYIIDNRALATSANLTNTAFSKRYEIGIMLSEKDTESIIFLYEKWWDEIAQNIAPNSMPKLARRRAKKEKEETHGEQLPELWEIPSDPGDPGQQIVQRFLDYVSFLDVYQDFSNLYAKVQRIWPNRPLYFETDSFLNYLFHHAPGLPTKKYYKSKPRILDKDERKKEIEKYAPLFKKWIHSGSEGVEAEHWREEHSATIKKLLSRSNIKRLNNNQIKQVVDCLHCMNSMPIQKFKFLNPKNNDIRTIKLAWYDLLYGEDSLPFRMNRCKNKLASFGRSSIQEILGNFNPQKYPIRNANCNSGLRFFGYDVSPY